MLYIELVLNVVHEEAQQRIGGAITLLGVIMNLNAN